MPLRQPSKQAIEIAARLMANKAMREAKERQQARKDLPTNSPQESPLDGQNPPVLSCYTPILDNWEGIGLLPLLPRSEKDFSEKK